MLSPRIREGETFRKTIESGGTSYPFEGYLTQTDIQMEQEALDYTMPGDSFRSYHPGIRQYSVDLSIAVTGDITREVIKKAKCNVQ